MIKEKKPSFIGALSVILFLCIAMVVQIFVLKQDWITHITLMLAAVFAAVVAIISGFTYDEVQEGILYGCKIAMLPMLILMMVGVLIGSLISAGTIPTLIYYGLQILSPSIFLVTVCLICTVASLSTGSSWTTGATFGVAFMGIGYGLGIPAPMVAGAIISGAIFGDKMSPLSDSTNLAAGVAEADLFDHIRSMIYTTGPAIIISFILYGIIGAKFSGGSIDTQQIDMILKGLKDNYYISPITLIPVIAVIILAIKRVNGLAVMIIASLIGGLFAIVFQGYSVGEVANFMNYGFTSETGIEMVDKLLSRGGLQSMMWTISLGFIALSFGGILEKTRMLEVILEKISNIVSNVKGLIITHVLTSIAVNLFSATQYIAIIIPSRMLTPMYKKLKILPQVNSRTSEDAATVTSPLVPWGLCGVYFTGVLGVNTVDYLPYVFLAYLAPLIAILYAVFGIFIFKEGDIKSARTYNDEAEDAL
ncbi:Na+/H+ antiporter NhaC [Wukongibacter baidiensis]|uniref:Na+/H+ antiporter NhaC n=1 Tax=Wukongibacter baidiensis TaxID=1723361 RepID=UPI003D7FE19F